MSVPMARVENSVRRNGRGVERAVGRMDMAV
jgi:hypothetical protein